MSATEPKTELQQKIDLFHTDLGGTTIIRDKSQIEPVADAMLALIGLVENKEIAELGPDVDLIGLINKRIAALDEEVNQGLNEVMHNKAFCELERSWRGLHYLVSRAET